MEERRGEGENLGSRALCACVRAYAGLSRKTSSTYILRSPPSFPPPLSSTSYSPEQDRRIATIMSVTTSSEKTYLGLQGRNLGLLISTIATTGFVLFGYDQGVMSGIIGATPFNTYFPETLNNSVYQGFVTAIYEIGCLLGAIFSLAYGDYFGRRKMVSSVSKRLWKLKTNLDNR